MPSKPPQSAKPASGPEQLLALDHQLCFALYSTSLAFTKLYRPLLSKLGLTYPQYLAMLALWEQTGAVSVSDLGGRLQLDSGTLTPLLKRMEAGGLITRARDAHDERRVLVSLTAVGEKLKSRAVQVPQSLCRATRCSLPELIALTHQVQALRRNLLEGIPAS